MAQRQNEPRAAPGHEARRRATAAEKGKYNIAPAADSQSTRSTGAITRREMVLNV